MIIQYVRKSKNNKTPKAVLVAIPDQKDGYSVGFALCNRRDLFCKTIARGIAVGRAMSKVSLPIPASIAHDVDAFLNRCDKYFKVK